MSKINPFYYSVGTRVRDSIFLNTLKPQSDDKILDVGCGLGYFTDLLSRQGADCTGIDMDSRCIDYCTELMSGNYQIADATKLPFPNNHFDKVLCTEVLEHINNNGVVLDEIWRVLKDNGTLVTSVPCSEGIFGSLFKRIGHNSVEGNSREYHWHKGYTKGEIVELLREHRFTANSTHYTLVAGVEAFMGLTKIVIHILIAKKIDSQANALEVEHMRLWKVYCKLFPVIWAFARLEQPLSRVIKGHMIIVEARCKK